MPKRIDLLGQTFGRLTVIAKGDVVASRQTWACSCACGGQKIIVGSELKRGHVASCGCLLVGNPKHGHGGRKASPTYRSWRSMLTRCRNPASVDYPKYGGAGITVCARWEKFENFLADMGERPSNTTIDRIENSKGYEPGNCRWATPREQVLNRGKFHRRWWKKPADIENEEVA